MCMYYIHIKSCVYMDIYANTNIFKVYITLILYLFMLLLHSLLYVIYNNILQMIIFISIDIVVWSNSSVMTV